MFFKKKLEKGGLLFLNLWDLKIFILQIKKGIAFVKADLKVWAQTCLGATYGIKQQNHPCLGAYSLNEKTKSVQGSVVEVMFTHVYTLTSEWPPHPGYMGNYTYR